MKKKLLAELIGTYLLIFFGTGSIIISEKTKAFGHLGVALIFGLVVMVLIYAFGHISGAHFNPAVSIGFYFNRDLNLIELVSYCVSQLVGAVLASETLLLMFGNVAELGRTAPASSVSQSFILEFILTFTLMIVILCSAVHGKATKSIAGIAIGATIAVEALAFGPISGASMNPIRSLAPAVVTGILSNLWIYLVATVLGAIVAVFVYNYALEDKRVNVSYKESANLT